MGSYFRDGLGRSVRYAPTATTTVDPPLLLCVLELLLESWLLNAITVTLLPISETRVYLSSNRCSLGV